MFDDDDFDFDFDSGDNMYSRRDTTWTEILIYLVVGAIALGFVAIMQKSSKEHFEECRQSCLKKGAESWNWGRYGCECGGATKHE